MITVNASSIKLLMFIRTNVTPFVTAKIFTKYFNFKMLKSQIDKKTFNFKFHDGEQCSLSHQQEENEPVNEKLYSIL